MERPSVYSYSEVANWESQTLKPPLTILDNSYPHIKERKFQCHHTWWTPNMNGPLQVETIPGVVYCKVHCLVRPVASVTTGLHST